MKNIYPRTEGFLNNLFSNADTGLFGWFFAYFFILIMITPILVFLDVAENNKFRKLEKDLEELKERQKLK